jgi:hypothetical protein
MMVGVLLGDIFAKFSIFIALLRFLEKLKVGRSSEDRERAIA